MMTYNFDPDFKSALKMLTHSPIDDPVKARKRYEQTIQLLVPEVDVSGLDIVNRIIPGFQSAPEIPVRLYIPQNRTKPSPALLDIHGGGFVIGSLETEHAVAAKFAQALDVVVMTVDYRLAPENPYPAGLHDCYATLNWLHQQVEALSLDADRIGVYGTSAGGGLAAGLTLFAKAQGGPAICFQCLNVPELDDRLQTVSMKQFSDTPIWDNTKAEVSWRYYLGELERGGDAVPVTAAPARAAREELTGLPAAFVSTMEFDPLRDEGVLYALNLMQAGVAVELHAYPGTFHGSSMFPVPVTKRQQGEMIAVLKRGLKIE